MPPIQSKIIAPLIYDAFNPPENAKLSIRFFTEMTDPDYDRLPYGLFAPMHEIPYAEHGRIDDATLVASWYEGISCAREITGDKESAGIEEALRKHLLNEGWDAESGLRFPINRPWSGLSDYALISEMATVLSALNRALALAGSDGDAVAERHAHDLVRGLRKIVTVHRSRMLGFGEDPIEFPCYSFVSDVYVKGKGFDPALSTGFSDSIIRYSALIDPLTHRHAASGDPVALDLAIGLANRISMLSHFFTVRTEFSGSTTATLRSAIGLIRLGKITGNEKYTQIAKGVYDFVRRNSSAFGWAPKYINRQLPADERCSGCCISAMMRCAVELVVNGYTEYLDDIHRCWRNHLEESQLTDSSFLPESDSPPPPDTEHRTYRDISARLRGAVSGGTAVNYLYFQKYGALSACCSAAAPQAMLAAWKLSCVRAGPNGIIINFPVNFENEDVKISVGYPNEGTVSAKAKRNDLQISFRVYPWMGAVFEGKVNGRPAPIERHDESITFEHVAAGMTVEIEHVMKTRRVMENVMGMDFFGVWRGPDMVDILPHGFPIRLYQRVAGQAKEVPDNFTINRSRHDLEPEIEPISQKDIKIVRRKPPKN